MNHKTHLITLLVAFSILIITGCVTATETIKPEFELTDTEWWVEDIGGTGVIDMSHTTVHFLEQDSVAGDTGCNRYRGLVEIVGANISFGPLAGTRKACAASLMDQEVKFYQAMASVVSWQLHDSGLLYLEDSVGNTVIRAWRVEK